MIFMVLSSWLRAIVRVYPVHLMNADCESAGRLLSFTFTIAILLLLNLKTETCVGWKADRSRHCRKVCSPCQRLYIAVAVMINTIQTCILSHCSWTRWPLDHCDLQDLPICFVNCCLPICLLMMMMMMMDELTLTWHIVLRLQGHVTVKKESRIVLLWICYSCLVVTLHNRHDQTSCVVRCGHHKGTHSDHM